MPGSGCKSVDVQGIKRMDPRPVYDIALDQKTTAMPLLDVGDIRSRLLEFGWVKDARVSRRFPDTLVIDIVERKPAALWQDEDRLTLIDAEGVVLDRVQVSQMPDLPLLIGKGANAQAMPLDRLLDPSAGAQGPAGVGDLGRPAPLGPDVSSPAKPSRFPKASRWPAPALGQASPRWTSRPGCSAAASSVSTCEFPAR